MKNYQHLFFDLDHTLWDFEKNSRETLVEIYQIFSLRNLGISYLQVFIQKYLEINDRMWEEFRLRKITRTELRVNRFAETLEIFKIHDFDLARNISEEYLNILPKKTNLFPYTHEILSYLKPKYKLHIITNGFEEVQYKKINNSKLNQYFKEIITSEKAESQKPDKKIFEYALNKAEANSAESMVIGDTLEVDIIGAREAGIDQVYFNPSNKKHQEKVTYEIAHLLELKGIL